MKKLIAPGMILFIAFSLFATIPPKKGGPLPPAVKEHTIKMQTQYARGNLARVMQKWAYEKKMAAQHPGFERMLPDTIDYRFPVLVGKYADATGVQPDAPQQLQKELFDGPWPTLTMREFYQENSYGQFALNGNVYGWIQAAYPESHYTGPAGTYGMSGYAALFVRELVDSVDATVDFSQYDNDGDGFVEAVIIVHSGPGQEYYGQSSVQNHIWSHSWNLASNGGYYYTNDYNANGIQVKVNHYIIQPAVNSDGSLISIGVFCHEFGHALGLPDLYDTDYSSEGIGEWGLMGGGSWNIPSSPSHFTAWSKEALGWLTPVVLDENQDLVNIPSVEDHPVAYKLWTEGNVAPYTSSYGAHVNMGRQYFLLENRERIGSDQHLHEPGLLIWHVDNSVFTGNTNENHKLVDLEEADGLNDLDNNVNSGDAGDPFPGSTHNTLFDYNSNPNSRAYNGADSKVSVNNIVKENELILANLEVGLIKFPILALNYDDTAGGNGNGIWEAGEQIACWFQIQNNTAATATNVTLHLQTTNPDLTIQNAVVNLGNIAPAATADNSGNPILINIDPAAAAYTAHMQFRLTMDGGYEKVKDLSFVIGVPPFLIIDKDITNLNLNDFKTWLDVNGYAYEIIAPDETPAVALRYAMRQTIAVIGGDNSAALTDVVLQDSLQNWLTTGNRGLLVIAPNGASGISGSTFASDVLHIQYEGTTSQIILKGVSGDPLGFNGGFVFLEAGDREMVSSPGGVTSVAFMGTTNGGLAHFEGGSNKIVFSTFDFRHIKGTSPVTRDAIMDALMNWFGTPTGIRASASALPEDFALEQNYPNPFNPVTTLRFYLPGERKKATLTIYNTLGEQVQSFDLAGFSAGWHSLKWDGRNHSGMPVSSGIYYSTLRYGAKQMVRKMILMK